MTIKNYIFVIAGSNCYEHLMLKKFMRNFENNGLNFIIKTTESKIGAGYSLLELLELLLEYSIIYIISPDRFMVDINAKNLIEFTEFKRIIDNCQDTPVTGLFETFSSHKHKFFGSITCKNEDSKVDTLSNLQYDKNGNFASIGRWAIPTKKIIEFDRKKLKLSSIGENQYGINALLYDMWKNDEKLIGVSFSSSRYCCYDIGTWKNYIELNSNRLMN